MAEQETLEINIRAKATDIGQITLIGDALKGVGVEVDNVAAKSDALTLKHKALASAHTATHGEAKKLEEAMHSSAIAFGANGEAAEHLSRKLGALQGLMGVGPGLAGTALIATAAVAGLVEGGKSAIENAEAHEKAEKSLKQALELRGLSVEDNIASTNKFIDANAKFIPNIYDATAGFAELYRSGLDVNQVTQAMSASIDLAALKHISLSEAVHQVNLGLHGSVRGLRDLGIDTKELAQDDDTLEKATKNLEIATRNAESANRLKEAADRSLVEEQQRLHDKHHVTTEDLMHLEDVKKRDEDATNKQRAAAAELAKVQEEVNGSTAKQTRILQELTDKVAGGRDTYTQLEKDQHQLNADWKEASQEWGPQLISVLDGVARGLHGAHVQLGTNTKSWQNLNDVLVSDAKDFANVHDAVQKFGERLNKATGDLNAYGDANTHVEQVSHNTQDRADDLTGSIDRQGAILQGTTERTDDLSDANLRLRLKLNDSEVAAHNLDERNSELRDGMIVLGAQSHTLEEALDRTKDAADLQGASLRLAGAEAHTASEHADELARSLAGDNITVRPYVDDSSILEAARQASQLAGQIAFLNSEHVGAPGAGPGPDASAVPSYIPEFAAGGLVTQKTLAWVGESGPELIVPLTGAGASSFQAGAGITYAKRPGPGQLGYIPPIQSLAQNQADLAAVTGLPIPAPSVYRQPTPSIPPRATGGTSGGGGSSTGGTVAGGGFDTSRIEALLTQIVGEINQAIQAFAAHPQQIDSARLSTALATLIGDASAASLRGARTPSGY